MEFFVVRKEIVSRCERRERKREKDCHDRILEGAFLLSYRSLFAKLIDKKVFGRHFEECEERLIERL